MVHKRVSLLVAMLAVVLFGCKSGGSQIAGSWTDKSTHSTWTFAPDGSYTMKGQVLGIDVSMDGKYAEDGANLTVTPSGKIQASSTDPSKKMAVDTINASPVRHVGPQHFTVAFPSANECQMTFGKGGADTHTLERN